MADIARLHTFVVGQPIKKQEVDAELDQIIARLNDLPLDSLSSVVQELLVPTGTILATGRSTANAGYLLCDGSAVSRVGANAALFAAIGTAYGVGDGSTTFNLPDLRGRAPVGVDGAAGRLAANDALGNSAGVETHTLTEAQIPGHVHGQPAHAHSFALDTDLVFSQGAINGSPGFNSIPNSWAIDANINFVNPAKQWVVWLGNGATDAAGAENTNSTGGGGSHNNLPPYQIVNYQIKL